MPITTRGFDSLIRTLDNIANTAEQRNDVLAQFLADEAQDRAKDLAPVKTGYLRDNIYWEKIQEARYKVIAHAFYSIFQEFGFQHYRDGFIPGKFYMTGGKEYIVDIVQTGAFMEEYMANISLQVEPPSDDV